MLLQQGAELALRRPNTATATRPFFPQPPPQARENASKGLYAELLFWKGANVAEDVRNEYNWRVGGCLVSCRRLWGALWGC